MSEKKPLMPLADGPVTHWEGCWKDPSHWRCAQTRVATLERSNTELREALTKAEVDLEVVLHNEATALTEAIRHGNHLANHGCVDACLDCQAAIAALRQAAE